MKVTSKINKTNLKIINQFTEKVFVKSVDALKTDVVKARIMPFDSGEMQNRNTWVDDKDIKRGIVCLRVDGAYPRRLYFHPEYNFQKIENPNAQGLWFEPWINGNKKQYIQIKFARLLREEYRKHESKGN